MNATENLTETATTATSRAPCLVETTIGVLLVVLVFASFTSNSFLIYTISRNKKLRSPANYLNVFLAAANIYGTVSELPLLAANTLSCRFIFNKPTCVLMGFVILSNACIAMYTLTVISIERYMAVCQPFRKQFDGRKCLAIIAIIALFSMAFSCLPFIGWSNYTFDYGHVTCWMNEDTSNRDAMFYFFFFIIFIFGACLFLLVFTNVNSIMTIRKSSRKLEVDQVKKKTLKKEAHLTKVSITSIASFSFSYAPYIILTFTRFAIGYSNLTFYVMTIFLARCSLLWPPLVILFMNKHIRQYVWQKNNNKTAAGQTTAANTRHDRHTLNQ